MSKEISLFEAKPGFAGYVRAVQEGKRLSSYFREGRSRLVPTEPPFPSAETRRVLTPEQESARERALERMRRGIRLGGVKLDRGELYDERCGVSGKDA